MFHNEMVTKMMDGSEEKGGRGGKERLLNSDNNLIKKITLTLLSPLSTISTDRDSKKQSHLYIT